MWEDCGGGGADEDVHAACQVECVPCCEVGDEKRGEGGDTVVPEGLVEVVAGVLGVDEGEGRGGVGEDANEARGAAAVVCGGRDGVGGGEEEEVCGVDEVYGGRGEGEGGGEEGGGGECGEDGFAVEVFGTVAWGC